MMYMNSMSLIGILCMCIGAIMLAYALRMKWVQDSLELKGGVEPKVACTGWFKCGTIGVIVILLGVYLLYLGYKEYKAGGSGGGNAAKKVHAELPLETPKYEFMDDKVDENPLNRTICLL
jgi:hypothetical protein